MISKYEFDIKSKEKIYYHPEEYYVEPFRIYGNLYFVGNKSVGSHLIDTGEGLILIDTTYPNTAALLIQSIWELGFNPRDICYILHTHGHFDHFGATNLIKALSGAQTFLGHEDARMFKESPELALISDSGSPYFDTFVPDVLVKDGDVIELGNTSIRIAETPGHSNGCISFFLTVEEHNIQLIAGMHGGAGMNTMCRTFIEHHHNSYCRELLLKGIENVYEESVDIMLGNHTGHNHTLEKRELMLKYPKKLNPFIDKSEWKRYLDGVLAKYHQMILDEKNGTDMK